MTALVPPERLLVYSVEQGREPLRAFLDVAVPAAPFPKVNDRAEFRKIIDRMRRGAYVILAVLGLAVAGAAYGVWWALS